MADLQGRYPEIDAAVRAFSDALEMDYVLPLFLVSGGTVGVYLHRVDYPPHGSAGLGKFIVTFHATEPRPSPGTPFRTFTLLTINERGTASPALLPN